jgi:hypothetical protein
MQLLSNVPDIIFLVSPVSILGRIVLSEAFCRYQLVLQSYIGTMPLEIRWLPPSLSALASYSGGLDFEPCICDRLSELRFLEFFSEIL